MLKRLAFSAAVCALAASGNIRADNVIVDDLIVDGSGCVGLDCVNGENFGFDTLRLKENNLRLHFDDTSVAASFPRNDWRILINDSANGGDSYFGIEDSTGGRIPFRVEAGAPSNTLFVESTGDVGFGTNNPVVRAHLSDGDTPTVRLEQNGSSGWNPQTWDLAGNETNFFVRDVTNGSKLPFRIRPGAPTSSVEIEADGDVNIGTIGGATSGARLQVSGGDLNVSRSDAEDTFVFIENTNAAGQPTGIKINNSATDDFWTAQVFSNGNFIISENGTGGSEFTIDKDGTGNQQKFAFKDGSQILFEVQADGDVNSLTGVFGMTSDRNAKKDINPVDTREILKRISEMPISTWRYKKNGDEVHMGPMGQDFYAAFGLHEGPTSVALGDLSGVALAAAKGLNEEIKEKDRQIQELMYRVAALEERLFQD